MTKLTPEEHAIYERARERLRVAIVQRERRLEEERTRREERRERLRRLTFGLLPRH